MPVEYLQHGRRHSPTGSDPIPGLPTGGGISWAYISQTGTSSCAGTSTTSLGATAGNFYTNDSSMYQAAANTGHEGIKILQVGHYFISCNVSPSTAPAAGSLYEVQVAGGGSVANFFGGKRVARIPTSPITDEGSVSAEYLMTVATTDLPVAALIAQIVNSGSGAVTLGVTGIFVYQLDTDTTVLV